MKITALLAAGLIAVGTLGVAAAPTAADAQRYGWHDGHRGPGYGRGNDGYRGGYRAGYRHRGYRGYGYRGGYRRGRVVCRVRHGYRGPVRTCFRR